MPGIDFASALYLGLRHPSRALPGWDGFTAGKPAALDPPRGADRVARRLAALQGCEAATIGSSTLHLFWDLFETLARRDVAVFMDAGTYPIARWGVERAAMHRLRVRRFPHHAPGPLRSIVEHESGRGEHPVIVADGFCPGCGRLAPLREYLAVARRGRGLLVVDDTQVLGILGEQPNASMPYGYGGGGSLRYLGISGPEVVLVSSLAKGFGAPLAALSASRRFVDDFERASKTRVHCSPPSVPTIQAAEHALDVNERHGEALRRKLLANLQCFRRGVTGLGLMAAGGLFPIQTLKSPAPFNAKHVHRRLAERGIHTVLRQTADRRPELTFMLTARHRRQDVDRAVRVLGEELENLFTNSPREGALHAQLD